MPVLLLLILLLTPQSALGHMAHDRSSDVRAGSDQPGRTPSLPWPERIALQPGLAQATIDAKGPRWVSKGTIEPVTGPIVDAHLSMWDNPTVKAEQQRDVELLKLRMLFPTASPARIEAEEIGSFVFVAPSDPKRVSDAGTAAAVFRFISARPGAASASGDRPLLMDRTWFALYHPLPPRVSSAVGSASDAPAPVVARGTVLLLPGMFGTPTEQVVALTRRLRQEGWAVLRMMSQPARFTQRRALQISIEGPLPDLEPVADELGDRAAEAAYAVEAAFMYVHQVSPALANKPRLAVGMSGGAMLLPIVISREPQAYAGAIAIAGGVDYLRILATSNYADWIDAVRVEWQTPPGAPARKHGDPRPVPSAERLSELSAAYRRLAPLDSANLAPALRNIPWLILHAAGDRAVPASLGDELWVLLGRPERIVASGGHEWIFITLGGRFGTMVSWLERASEGRVPVPFQSKEQRQ